MPITIGVPIDPSPHLFQFSPQLLRKWQVARGNVLAGVQNAKIACVGDSTTVGTGANASTSLYRQRSYPAQMSLVLAGLGLPSSAQNFFGTGNLTLASSDTRFTTSGAFSQGAVNTTLGGALLQMTGVATLTWTPTVTCNRHDIYTVQVAGGGSYDANIDGGASLATISGNGTAMTKTTVTGTGTALNLVRASGTCYVAGVSSYTSTTPTVEVWNMGASGALASTISDASLYYSERNALAFYAPDLTLLMIGINDWQALTNDATFAANMQSIITTAKISGDVVLMTPVPTGGSASLSRQKAYIDALYELAFSNQIPLIDHWSRWGEYSALNTAGFFFDTLHPSGPGYADIALTTGRALAYV